MNHKNKYFYRRNLPHWQPKGVSFAINFRLAGSLPAAVIKKLQQERDWKLEEIVQQRLELLDINRGTLPSEIEHELIISKKEALSEYQGKFHDLLDGTKFGPKWLAKQDIAEIVKNAIHFLEERGDWIVWAYCIMPNHVHLIVSDVKPILHKATKSLKQFSARKANQILGRTGQPFWHRESYDHIIRNPKEMTSQILYTINNPVKAELIAHWEDWPFTYLNPNVTLVS